MSDCDLYKTILESGLEGAAIILLAVIAYKIYKMKILTSSKCCDDNVQIRTQNEGDNPANPPNNV